MGKYQELAGAHFASRSATVEARVDFGATADAVTNGIMDALRAAYEGAVLPEAKGLCPVGTDPIEPGSQRNRDSLDFYLWVSKRGPRAKLFSQSGHGGYVEVGTIHMSGQPYAWPAVQGNLGLIMEGIRTALREAKVQPGRTIETTGE